MHSFIYLEGWSQGVQMIEAGWGQKECLDYALWMIKARKDDVAIGFYDAIMAGGGL